MTRINNQNNIWERFKPWIASLVLLPVILYYTYNHGRFTFIDFVNLLIHEGGHGVFSFFGRFIYTLGGTLAQIIVPGMFIVYYARTRKKVMTQIFLVWLGENLINISVYAADARAHKLPLLGGKKVYHDWTYLLNQMNLILYDQEVGLFFYLSGIVVFIIALLIPLFIRQYQQTRINLQL